MKRNQFKNTLKDLKMAAMILLALAVVLFSIGKVHDMKKGYARWEKARIERLVQSYKNEELAKRAKVAEEVAKQEKITQAIRVAQLTEENLSHGPAKKKFNAEEWLEGYKEETQRKRVELAQRARLRRIRTGVSTPWLENIDKD